MIQYFKNIGHQTIAVDKPDSAVWVNILPPLKQEEFTELSELMNIPVDFLKDSLDIDERSRYEIEGQVKLIVIKIPTENNSFNLSDAFYITIPICLILTNNQNEILKKLTTLTIFLSVPVLIASIYGMNVPIPYGKTQYAFWAPVILSIVILGLAVWNYWKKLKK